MRPWLKALFARPSFKVVAVAQANKTARIICALLKKGGTYRHPNPLSTTAAAVRWTQSPSDLTGAGRQKARCNNSR
ncbi:hypothetical protein ACVWY3_004954 [Bradyrhizobium sp. USDA 4486]